MISTNDLKIKEEKRQFLFKRHCYLKMCKNYRFLLFQKFFKETETLS